MINTQINCNSFNIFILPISLQSSYIFQFNIYSDITIYYKNTIRKIAESFFY